MEKGQKHEILRFLLERNIPIWQAIEILEQEEQKIKIKLKVREKAILPKHETR